MKTTCFEIWALGYDREGACTNLERYLGEYATSQYAIQEAEKLQTLEDVVSPEFALQLRSRGEYVTIQVQETAVCDDPEDGTECIDVIFEADLY